MSGWDIRDEDVKPCATCGRPTWFGLHLSKPGDVDDNRCPNHRLAGELVTLRAQLAERTAELAQQKLLTTREDERANDARQKLRDERGISQAAWAELQRARRAARAWKALVKHYRDVHHCGGVVRCEDEWRPVMATKKRAAVEKAERAVARAERQEATLRAWVASYAVFALKAGGFEKWDATALLRDFRHGAENIVAAHEVVKSTRRAARKAAR